PSPAGGGGSGSGGIRRPPPRPFLAGGGGSGSGGIRRLRPRPFTGVGGRSASGRLRWRVSGSLATRVGARGVAGEQGGKGLDEVRVEAPSVDGLAIVAGCVDAAAEEVADTAAVTGVVVGLAQPEAEPAVQGEGVEQRLRVVFVVGHGVLQLRGGVA